MKYRVNIDMIENGYVDIETETKNIEKIKQLAEDKSNNGGFIGTNSHAEIGEVIINE